MANLNKRLILFNIVIWAFVILLLTIGVINYGIDTKEGALILIGSAVGAFIGVSLESMMFKDKFFKKE